MRWNTNHMTGVVPFESPNLEQNSHLWRISAFRWKSAKGCFLTQRQAGFVTRLLVGSTQLELKIPASWDNLGSTALQSNSQSSWWVYFFLKRKCMMFIIQSGHSGLTKLAIIRCSHSLVSILFAIRPYCFFLQLYMIRCVLKERWEHQNDLVNETWFFSVRKNICLLSKHILGQCLCVNYLRQSQVMGAQVFMTPFLAAIYVVNPGERKHTETLLMFQKSWTSWYSKYPNTYKFQYISGGCLGFLNHQHRLQPVFFFKYANQAGWGFCLSRAGSAFKQWCNFTPKNQYRTENLVICDCFSFSKRVFPVPC